MPGGGVVKYKPEYCDQAYRLALLGLTDIEMAKYFCVVESTWHKWKLDYPTLSESIRAGKEGADTSVAKALYHRARGYDAWATKFAISDGKITDSVDYIQHYPPDPTSCIFWLKNRQKGKWRDKIEMEHSGDQQLTINFDIPRPKIEGLDGDD